MRKFFKNKKLYFIGGVVGGIFGYLYYKLIGCNSGTCAITSKPLNSIIYFTIVGSILFGSFKSKNYVNN
jgi:hypothetical protein